MSRSLVHLFLSLLLLCCLAPAGLAQDDADELSGYPGSFQRDYESTAKKLLALAATVPADKYGWRPTDEVRSVSETLVHVAGANFYICQVLGVPGPEEFGSDAEQKITAKDDVIKTLKQSIDHVYRTIRKDAGADLDAELDMFGRKRARRDAFMILSGHAHEHLGQLIAYVRTMGLTPPWSQPQPKEGGEGDEGDGGGEGGEAGGEGN
ncbi:MAG: DinB family protein [bacterium]|nr:DinB family protein [bacterium]